MHSPRGVYIVPLEAGQESGVTVAVAVSQAVDIEETEDAALGVEEACGVPIEGAEALPSDSLTEAWEAIPLVLDEEAREVSLSDAEVRPTNPLENAGEATTMVFDEENCEVSLGDAGVTRDRPLTGIEEFCKTLPGEAELAAPLLFAGPLPKPPAGDDNRPSGGNAIPDGPEVDDCIDSILEDDEPPLPWPDRPLTVDA